jgi:hypothetical protein
MSLALATKGVIAGIGFGSGEGGKYPADYIAAVTNIGIDLSQEVEVAMQIESVEVQLDLSEEINIEVDLDVLQIQASPEQETVEVEV